MTDEPTNMVLEYLRRLDRKVDKIGEDVSELKTRMIALEGHMASFHVQVSGHSSEIERINQRIERIERRLELTDR
jgi:predicted  nucleic acid-binding Zn-ribbon protein